MKIGKFGGEQGAHAAEDGKVIEKKFLQKEHPHRRRVIRNPLWASFVTGKKSGV